MPMETKAASEATTSKDTAKLLPGYLNLTRKTKTVRAPAPIKML